MVLKHHRYPQECWICIDEPEGYTMFCINTFRYRNSLEIAGLNIGDEFFIVAHESVKTTKHKQ